MNSQTTSDTTGDHALSLTTPRSLAGRVPFHSLRRVIDRWMERSRQRRALSKLSDSALADIGITRFDAERETAKPFWR